MIYSRETRADILQGNRNWLSFLGNSSLFFNIFSLQTHNLNLTKEVK
jgi:hypothetical protein